MLQFDANSLDALTLLLLVLAAIAISAFTGIMTSAGWRNSAKRDLELYEILKRNADCEEDDKAMAALKSSAVRSINYRANMPARIIDRLMWVSTEFLPLFFVVAAPASFAIAFCFPRERWAAIVVFVLLVLIGGFDVYSRYRKNRHTDSRGN